MGHAFGWAGPDTGPAQAGRRKIPPRTHCQLTASPMVCLSPGREGPDPGARRRAGAPPRGVSDWACACGTRKSATPLREGVRARAHVWALGRGALLGGPFLWTSPARHPASPGIGTQGVMSCGWRGGRGVAGGLMRPGGGPPKGVGTPPQPGLSGRPRKGHEESRARRARRARRAAPRPRSPRPLPPAPPLATRPDHDLTAFPTPHHPPDLKTTPEPRAF